MENHQNDIGNSITVGGHFMSGQLYLKIQYRSDNGVYDLIYSNHKILRT